MSYKKQNNATVTCLPASRKMRYFLTQSALKKEEKEEEEEAKRKPIK
jgi:hypothetical protein